jgi:hypothetical protein
MDKFAKLFETDLGQILVKLDANDEECPEVRIYFQPPDLGVCSVALSGWGSDEDAWDKADKCFSICTKEKCRSIVSEQLKFLSGS